MTRLRQDYAAWKSKNERRQKSVHSRVVEVGGDALRELDPDVDFLRDRSLYTNWQWPHRFQPTSELRARVVELMKEGADPLVSNVPATFSDSQLRKMFRAIDTVYFKRTLSAWLAPYFTQDDISFTGPHADANVLACVWTTITNRAHPCRLAFNRDLWYSVDFTAAHYPKRMDKIHGLSRLEHMVVVMCHELVHVINGVNTVKHNRDHGNRDGATHGWHHDDRFKTLARNLFGHKMGHVSEDVNVVEIDH